MPKVPIPFTQESIDPTGDPSGAVWTIALLAIGFAGLGLASSFGDDIRDGIMNRLPFGSDGESGRGFVV